MIWIAALCAVGLAAGFLLIWRVPACPRTCQTDRIAVSVIIPARNEERSLPRLLDSIRRSQCQPYEVIVVDDGSSDRTAEVAIARRARVITSQPLPEGWTGKTWACHQGANEAAAEVIAFS
jgi:4,4'-diaponeurosporenoate glycosyltransferase